VETGALIGERGAYRLTRPIQAIDVPSTVQVILAARIDRLSAEDKQLLQTAKVIGKDVPLILLQAVAEPGEDAVHRGLTNLQSAEFLYETRLFPDSEYTFKHALTHEVAYVSLLQGRRRTLHARIVHAMEALYPEPSAEQIDRLAHHACGGQLWSRAADYFREAAARAFARSANQQAVIYGEQALSALQRLPETRETLAQGIDIRCNLRASLWTLGETTRIRAHLDEAEQLARRAGDEARLGRVSVLLSHYFWVTANLREARKCALSAQHIGSNRQDFPLRIGAEYYLGTTAFSAGDYAEANGQFLKVIGALSGELALERCGLATFPAAARSWLAWSLAEQGAFEEGIVHGLEAIRVSEDVDHAYSLSQACWNLGVLHGIRGNFTAAVELAERSLALASGLECDRHAAGGSVDSRVLAGAVGRCRRGSLSAPPRCRRSERFRSNTAPSLGPDPFR
jgi:tetratricopeptide (TPR) repeat protein